MNLTELQQELDIILRDISVDTWYKTWLNESVKELAYQFDLPALRLKLPATLTTTTSNWQYNISDATPPDVAHVYMKNVFKITNSAHPQGIYIRRDVQLIDEIDYDHDETGDDVDNVAVEDDGNDNAVIAIHPMANDTLNLWYYRKPVEMSSGFSVPDGIPSAFHMRVLLPYTVLKAFRVYPDLATENEGDNTRSLQWWEGKLRTGLYGDGYQIGMIQSLRKSSRPRVRAPRPGGNLSGSDRFIVIR